LPAPSPPTGPVTGSCWCSRRNRRADVSLVCEDLGPNWEDGLSPRRAFMAVEILVVQSKVKDYLKAQDARTDGDLVEALSVKVGEILDRAVERCAENGRSTVRPCDL